MVVPGERVNMKKNVYMHEFEEGQIKWMTLLKFIKRIYKTFLVFTLWIAICNNRIKEVVKSNVSLTSIIHFSPYFLTLTHLFQQSYKHQVHVGRAPSNVYSLYSFICLFKHCSILSCNIQIKHRSIWWNRQLNTEVCLNTFTFLQQLNSNRVF